MIKGVMFDFSGTVFHIESVREWFDAVPHGLSGAELDACVERLTVTGALPGGPQPHLAPAGWDQRDLTAGHHRRTYTAQTLAALLPDFGPDRAPVLAELLYDRHMTAGAWRQPYPDAEAVFKELRRRGVPIAVLSNIGWDLRPIFVQADLDEYVDAYVLSFELEIQKPDPRIFQAACDLLKLPPAEVLMVGDTPDQDGAATALGCAFLHVPPLPVAERPDALLQVLACLPAESGSLPADSGSLPDRVDSAGQ